MTPPHLVLLGGGHTHALLLKLLSKGERPFSKITLVSDQAQTSYSGMVPGFIEGIYSEEDVFIDLVKLCKKTDVDFVTGRVATVDADKKAIELESKQELRFDLLSINTGSRTNNTLDTSDSWGISVKPMNRFIAQWQISIEKMLSSTKNKQLAVLGGGAAGFEILMALKAKFGDRHSLCWLFSGDVPLGKSNASLGRKLALSAETSNITLKNNFKATKRTEKWIFDQSNEKIPCDFAFYCLGAAADHWPTNSNNINLTANGFISTNSYLQAKEHKHIFAVGDVASQENTHYPKAGVYAVRQAPILHKNLVNISLGKTLVAFKPQKEFLALLSKGHKKAIGVKQNIIFEGKWVWRLKNFIDGKFMNQFK